MNTKKIICGFLLLPVAATVALVWCLRIKPVEKSPSEVEICDEPVCAQPSPAARLVKTIDAVPPRALVGEPSLVDELSRSTPENIPANANRSQTANGWVEPVVTAENASKIFDVLNGELPSGIQRRSWYAAQNRMMASLCSLTSPDANVTEELVLLSGNDELDVVTRNYALQYLAYYQHKKEDDAGRELIRTVLWSSVQNGEKELAPTALLALSRLNQDKHEKDRLVNHAVTVLQERHSSRLLKIAAVSVCEQLDARSAVPELQQAAKQNHDLPLKMAAINSLKKMNDPWATDVEAPCISLQQ